MRKSGELEPASREELLSSIDALCDDVARERVASLIDRREYAVREVRDALRRDGFSESCIGRTISNACRAGLVSDARYADAYIRTKVCSGWGMARIARELRAKGIEVEDVQGWPYEYLDPDDEETRAREVAQRKHVREPHAYEKLVRFLMGRGFSYAVASRVAREQLNDEP